MLSKGESTSFSPIFTRSGETVQQIAEIKAANTPLVRVLLDILVSVARGARLAPMRIIPPDINKIARSRGTPKDSFRKIIPSRAANRILDE